MNPSVTALIQLLVRILQAIPARWYRRKAKRKLYGTKRRSTHC